MSKENDIPLDASAPHGVDVLHGRRSIARDRSYLFEGAVSVAWVGLVVASIASIDASSGAKIVLSGVCSAIVPILFELGETKRRLARLVSAVEALREQRE